MALIYATLVTHYDEMATTNLSTKELWRVAEATNDTKTTSVGDGSSELWTGSDVHAGEQNGMLDAKKLSNRC